MKIEIRAARAEDGAYVAAHLRRSDRDELAATAPIAGPTAIARSIRAAGPQARAGLIDGVPACVFGVSALSVLSDVGAPWLVGTAALERHAVPFLRRNRGFIAQWRGLYARLENMVDARHTVSVRWLGWLGFTLDPPFAWGHAGLLFHRFWMPGIEVADA